MVRHARGVGVAKVNRRIARSVDAGGGDAVTVPIAQEWLVARCAEIMTRHQPGRVPQMPLARSRIHETDGDRVEGLPGRLVVPGRMIGQVDGIGAVNVHHHDF